MLKKIACIVICLIMMVCSMPIEQNVICAENLLGNLSSEELEFYSRQSDSVEQYQALLSSFNESSKVRIVNQQCYDSNYGGAYINDDGNLVVLLVETTSQEKKRMRTITENRDLIIQSCEYSFNELINVIDIINANLENLSQKEVIIASMYEDVYDNRVKINVLNLTDEKEMIIRNVIDAPCMVISNAIEPIKNDVGVDIRGGDGVTNLSTGRASTIGFCASGREGYGFIVAGHTANIGDRFSSSGTYIGTVTDSAYYMYSTADAAFIKKDPAVNVTNNIGVFKCHYRATELSDYPVGAQITKLGLGNEITPYTTTGKILSNYYTSADGTYYITGQCKASYEAKGGDSGGPVFMVKDVVNGNITCKLLGIHKAHHLEYGHTDYYAVFSKFHLIEYELDVQAVMY